VRLLADTGALLAFMLKRDQHHQDASRFVRQHPEARFVLTDLILSELVTRLRARAGAERAAAAGRSLIDSRRYNVVFVDAPLVRSAFARMEQFADKTLSLPDCVSFELIDRLGLDGAFAFDCDFRDCGYTSFP
jgi:predicted nucleic acid-binding protein